MRAGFRQPAVVQPGHPVRVPRRAPPYGVVRSRTVGGRARASSRRALPYGLRTTPPPPRHDLTALTPSVHPRQQNKGALSPQAGQSLHPETPLDGRGTITNNPKRGALLNFRQMPETEQNDVDVTPSGDDKIARLAKRCQTRYGIKEKSSHRPRIPPPPGENYAISRAFEAVRPGEHAPTDPIISDCDMSVPARSLERTLQTFSTWWPSRPKRVL